MLEMIQLMYAIDCNSNAKTWFSLEDRHFREIHIPVGAAFAQQISQDDPQAMLDFALRLRQEKDPGAVEWLRATGRKGHPLACMSAVRAVKGIFY